MVDTEMTATPTQQPEALKLADVLHEVASLFGFPYALSQSAAELRFQHDEIARLTAENEALKAAVSDAVAAEREALRGEPVDGIVHPPAPQQEAQEPVAWRYNRLGSCVNPWFKEAGREADDLRVGRWDTIAGLYMKPSENHVDWTPLYAAPQPAPAPLSEREACEERVEDLYEKIETPYLVDITRAIHARDKA